MRYENLVRSLPPEFLDRMRRVSGADGKRWIETLPEIIEIVSRRFDVGSLKPVEDLSYHFVAFAERRTGGSCVVKVGVANRDSLAEAAALDAFAGRGACTLFGEIDASADDPAYVALLLERCDPGRTLRDWRSLPERTNVAAEIFARLHSDGGPPPDVSAAGVASGYEDLLRGVVRRLGLSVRGIYPGAAAPGAVGVDDRAAFTSRAGNEVLRTAEHLVECALPLVEKLRASAEALLHGAVLDSVLSMLWSIEGGDPHDDIVQAFDRCRVLLEISSSRA